MSLQEREEKSQTQGGCHVKMVTEIGEPCHQVKENIRARGEAQEARRKQEIVSLTVSRIISPANILILNLLATIETREQIPIVEATQFIALCY